MRLKPADFKVVLKYVKRWDCEPCMKEDREQRKKSWDELAMCRVSGNKGQTKTVHKEKQNMAAQKI
jgi:hypothetical protein